jgi:hypothetical protein
VEGRFEAFHASGLTELVGREEELELLLRRWSKTKSGQGQVVLLSGEPGIGKSRLTAALVERVATDPHTRLRYFCSPQHTDSALYPIISQMERAAGFAHDDKAKPKLDKLDALLTQSLTAVAAKRWTLSTAGGGAARRKAGADQITDDYKARCDADARLKRDVGLQGTHCGHHLQPSAHSPLSVVLVGLGIAEVD